MQIRPNGRCDIADRADNAGNHGLDTGNDITDNVTTPVVRLRRQIGDIVFRRLESVLDRVPDIVHRTGNGREHIVECRGDGVPDGVGNGRDRGLDIIPCRRDEGRDGSDNRCDRSGDRRSDGGEESAYGIPHRLRHRPDRIPCVCQERGNGGKRSCKGDVLPG